ncbi:MAG TPA: glycerophosphodiester phosphodiesterase [Candidatus Nitrosotalea sp.]|nr:glycerophosphodiester phosphodiesterase [Candidatus Nitrosotalea sp.]
MSPLISAHHGSCGVDGLPTTERYRRAIDQGVDFVEFDIRRTVDGQYVIYHDPRTPSGRGIAEISIAEFRTELGPDALDLPELLEMAKGRVGLHIDLKEVGYEADVVRVVLADFTESQFVITSLEVVSIRAIKERFPTVRAGLSLGRDLDHATPWHWLGVRLSELFPANRLTACRADFVAVHKRLATLRVLAFCAREKIPAWVWTLEDELDTAPFWSDPRVAVVIADRPDLVPRLSR